MKKLWWIPLVVILLAGCGGERALETVSDVQDTPVAAMEQKVLLQLPPEMSKPALESEEAGTLYLCDDYSVTVQTVPSGDLAQTILTATGRNKDDLQILKTQTDGVKRYQWVWSANADTGIQVGRGCILDDGAYHYVLTALTDEGKAGQVQPAWQEIFASFRLTEEKEDISTGS